MTAVIGLLALVPFIAVQIAGIGKIVEGVSGGTIPYAVAAGLDHAWVSASRKAAAGLCLKIR